MVATMEREATMPTGFGKRLAEVMEEKGMSGYRLAQLIGMSPQGISIIRAGRSDPSWEMAVKISKALGVPLDELISDDISLPTAPEVGKAGRPRKQPAKRKPRK